jgi:hypothetical protein
MGLGDLIREVKQVRERGAFLLPLLVEQLYERSEVHLRQDMWFSPSMLSHMCPRAYAIAWKMDVPLVREFMPDNRFAMDFGTAMHMLMQDIWGGNGGWLIGGWKCSECGHKHGIDSDDKVPAISHGETEPDKVTVKSSIHQPKVCEACGMRPGWRKEFTYVEPMLYNLDLRVCGWCDGIMILPGQPAELIDFKTTAAPYWIRKEPNRDHVAQLSWYMDMAGIKRGRIIYIDRTAKKLEDAIIEHSFFLDKKLMAEQKEMVSGVRKILEAPKEESSIPACPDGGRGPFGPCDCAEFETIWKSHGARFGTQGHGSHDSL